MKLYTVAQVMSEPAMGYFQFSPGARDGIPWRHDSVYLPLAAYECLADALHACAATGVDVSPLAASLARWLSAHVNAGITIERI